MYEQVTVEDLITKHKELLQLNWIAGKEGAKKVFCPEPEELSTMVGYLNFVHPQKITVLGKQEFDYLAKLEVSTCEDSIAQIFNSSPILIVASDSQLIPSEMKLFANNMNIPLISSAKSGQKVISHLSHFLSTKLAHSMTVHGVFLEVFDLGVLITGESGVGKSELALELITRKHRLIADDSPTLTKFTPEAITGICSPILQDFLEVRGIGILNVRALYGSTAVKDKKQLHLIVKIVPCSDDKWQQYDRLTGSHRSCEILGVQIPEVAIPIAPGRNLAILVEAAVRNQLLNLSGYHAPSVFDARQKKYMENLK